MQSVILYVGRILFGGYFVMAGFNHFAKLQQPNLGADDLLFLGHDRCPFETPRPGAAHPDHSAPGLGFRLSYDIN